MEAASKLSRRAPLRLRVKFLTQVGVLYDVRYANRQSTCTCPDARYRQRACKHVQRLLVLGMRRAVRLAGSMQGDGSAVRVAVSRSGGDE